MKLCCPRPSRVAASASASSRTPANGLAGGSTSFTGLTKDARRSSARGGVAGGRGEELPLLRSELQSEAVTRRSASLQAAGAAAQSRHAGMRCVQAGARLCGAAAGRLDPPGARREWHAVTAHARSSSASHKGSSSFSRLVRRPSAVLGQTVQELTAETLVACQVRPSGMGPTGLQSRAPSTCQAAAVPRDHVVVWRAQRRPVLPGLGSWISTHHLQESTQLITCDASLFSLSTSCICKLAHNSGSQ